MTAIWIDGDGCPKGATSTALLEGAKRGLRVVVVTNVHHQTVAPERLVVDGSAQSVDLAIVNRMQKGDVVITQDIGLAAIVVGKKGFALHPTGKEFTVEEMPLLLEMRESAAKHRRGGGRTRGPKKRTVQDEAMFRAALCGLLDRIVQEDERM